MVEISPSILSADFARLGEQIAAVKSGGATMLHIDVMDGRFVPNISVGLPVVQSLRATTDLLLDCHLMTEEPDRYVPGFVEAGANMISVHEEACSHLDRSVNLIRSLGVEAGVVLNPATPVHALDDVLEAVDFVLIMSVNPGFGGQKLLPHTLEKVRRIKRTREDRQLDFRIQIDGGVNLTNLPVVVEAGCDIVVTGSAIFGTDDPRAALKNMRRILDETRLVEV
ncbi:MAG: ribulose-phosphate 3-epimerase [Solibacterales bacterium]|nr:ribulose-phosphate 3-epimerase [Bryobacterales bacterium]|tara:strand:- start:2682 stop:3356 length:675 start_codon:yes stop_codon:yes gene_type:complete